MRRLVTPSRAAAAGSVARSVTLAVPGLAGAGALAYGAWLAWPPAGWMTGGVVVLADVVWSRVGARRPRGEQR